MKSMIYPWFELTGCCEQLLSQLESVVASWGSLGMVEKASSPSSANLLVIGGWINHEQSRRIKSVYDEMPEPKKVVAYGACAISASPFSHIRNHCFTAKEVVPVDQYVTGCPPRWDDLLRSISDEFSQRAIGDGIKDLLNENSSESVF